MKFPPIKGIETMASASLRVGSHTILPSSPALVVAEIGQNHNGEIALAEQLIDAASWAGADAVKITKRDLNCELSSEASQRPYLVPHAFGLTYGEHRAALELSFETHCRLAQRVREHGMTYLGTACDIPSADLLCELNVDAIKIASRDLPNLPLIAYVARLGKTIILSTGMSDLVEIDQSVSLFNQANTSFMLMQCTSLYPTPYEQSHLRSMQTLAQRYQVPVGFSDHTSGVLLPPVAVAMGAPVIEKHITLNRASKGGDHACSLEPDEFQQMVQNIRIVETALGSSAKPVPHEIGKVKQRLGRSLVTKVPLQAGMLVEEPMLTLKCPGDGIAWLDRSKVVGKRVRRDIPADEKIVEEDLY